MPNFSHVTRKVNLSLWYIGQYEILELVGDLAYKSTHNRERVDRVSHIYQIYKPVIDSIHVLNMDTTELEAMTYKEQPIKILDHKMSNTKSNSAHYKSSFTMRKYQKECTIALPKATQRIFACGRDFLAIVLFKPLNSYPNLTLGVLKSLRRKLGWKWLAWNPYNYPLFLVHMKIAFLYSKHIGMTFHKTLFMTSFSFSLNGISSIGQAWHF